MTALFSTFDVTRQVFFKSRLSIGIVNLKPLLPGHVLLIPRRVVPRLADLNQEEITDLFLSVQQVGRIIEKAYHAKALTISLQDGKSAGQSVAHVHVHMLPRTGEEYGGVNDEVYPKLEENEGKLQSDLKGGWEGLKDEDRKARSMEDMEKEAEWLSGLFRSE